VSHRFNSLGRDKLRDKVLTAIREAILEERLAPGERLIESTLAEEMGVSRAPVREALLSLEREGVVSGEPYRGYSIVSLSTRDVTEIATLRALIEAYAARLAATRWNDHDFEEAQSLFAQIEEATHKGNLPTLIKRSLAFHRHLVSMAKHERLLKSWDALSGQVQLYLLLLRRHSPQPAEWTAFPEAIVDALRQRDAEAASELVWETLVRAGEDLTHYLHVEQGDPESAPPQFSPRECMLRALSREPTPEIPIAVPYKTTYLGPQKARLYIDAYSQRMKQQTNYPLQHEEDTEIRAKVLDEVFSLLAEPDDRIEVFGSGSRAWAERTEIQRLGDRYFFVDRLTGIAADIQLSEERLWHPCWRELLGLTSGTILETWDRRHDFASKGDIERHVQPLTASQLLSEGYLDLAHKLVEQFGHQYLTYTPLGTPFWSVIADVGTYGALTWLQEEPGLAALLQERRLRQRIEMVHAFAEVGLDAVLLEELLCGADTIPDAIYARQIAPYTRRLIEAIQQAGMKAILLFTGDVEPRLPRILELAPDALAVENAGRGYRVDLWNVVQTVGQQMCVFGNLPVADLLRRSGSKEIEREVQRQVAIALETPGFVLSLESVCAPETPLENLEAFIAAGRKLGRRPWPANTAHRKRRTRRHKQKGDDS